MTARVAAIALTILPILVSAQQVPRELPAPAVTQLAHSLSAAAPHRHHLWRDTAPTNSDGTVNGYIEIPLGERRKYEFDMGRNVRAIDRVMPAAVGGYPVNYGFVPQTVSYDGDPFDVLVLGSALPGGEFVRGAIVGVMYMEDEKGLDSKVVLSPIGTDGRAMYELTATVRNAIGGYFQRYKRGEEGKFSRVPGWGTVGEGRDLIATTHAFFLNCRTAAATCRLP